MSNTVPILICYRDYLRHYDCSMGGLIQATRKALRRLFVRRPELLVLDDLSSVLDVEAETQLPIFLEIHIYKDG